MKLKNNKKNDIDDGYTFRVDKEQKKAMYKKCNVKQEKMSLHKST